MSEIEENIWLATYGTLKKGYNNYNLHLTNSKYMGGGTTQEMYPLIIKDLPYLIEDIGNGFQIEVDVFKISKPVLERIDELEIHPTWYRRKQIPILLNGNTVTCWIYFSMTESIGSDILHKTYKQESDSAYLGESFLSLQAKANLESIQESAIKDLGKK
jgi:gamma-glutamylaminecyclotransferase